ncbi:hypothetical protein Mgra_00008700 [Meloidogyne graminicola]|uniref:Uncharacterized protein n=1 Tax=Meloidogyne graminicola TaxID=189291 RepID=A0A8S9ZEY0_9BILA|nr:hypothetical protein Mgra_00008700 [Meloidogyne graminicola]
MFEAIAFLYFSFIYILLSLAPCFVVGSIVYIILNYRNEKAEYERIQRLQMIEYARRKKMQEEQLNAFAQPCFVFPVPTPPTYQQYPVNERSSYPPPPPLHPTNSVV